MSDVFEIFAELERVSMKALKALKIQKEIF